MRISIVSSSLNADSHSRVLTKMKIAKPRYLYHGSPEKLDRIEPRPARGVGPEKDRLHAVYATHIQNLAIVFSLPFIPNQNNNLSFQVSFQTDRT